jgi:hypothetical protein
MHGYLSSVITEVSFLQLIYTHHLRVFFQKNASHERFLEKQNREMIQQTFSPPFYTQ